MSVYLMVVMHASQWVVALSKYKAWGTTGPNFGLALVVRKTPEGLRDKLDLSHLKYLIAGAETIRKEVVDDFYGYFSKCGINPLSFMPAYGLAEFTLCATAHEAGNPMKLLHVDKRLLSQEGRAVSLPEDDPEGLTLVSVGEPFYDDGSACLIVDPETNGRMLRRWADR